MMGLIPKMMESMGGGDPEQMRGTMSQMMPAIMKECFGSMSSEDMLETMHEMMPQMMENCFASISREERERMLAFCSSVLLEMKEKF